MNKKILAFLMSILICAACIAPITAFAEEAAEPAADPASPDLPIAVMPGTDEDAFLESIINEILNENDGETIDLTQIVIAVLSGFDQEELESMSGESEDKVQQVVQSAFDSVADMIGQASENKELLTTYDPLKVIDNLFDLNTSSLTTQAHNDKEDPNELKFQDGDVDMDGKITAADARLILRRAAHLVRFTDEQDRLADVDKDGVITAVDARIVLRIVAGLPIEAVKENTSESTSANLTENVSLNVK